MRRIAPPSVLLLLSLLTAAPAAAWQQTMTCLEDDPPAPTSTPYCVGDELAKPFHWPDPTVVYTVNRSGLEEFGDNDGEISDELLQLVRTSFDTWNEPECSIFVFEYGGLTHTDEYAKDDGENAVIMQDEDWPYASDALALTSVTADPEGVIVNADMEINGTDHVFGDDGAMDKWDVQNTITHEAGHVLGLDHSGVADSTMAFNAKPGETKKRDLHPDDIEGLCTIYDPETFEREPDDPRSSPGGGGGCCAVVDGGVPAAPVVALLLTVVTIARRRFPR